MADFIIDGCDTEKSCQSNATNEGQTRLPGNRIQIDHRATDSLFHKGWDRSVFWSLTTTLVAGWFLFFYMNHSTKCEKTMNENG